MLSMSLNIATGLACCTLHVLCFTSCLHSMYQVTLESTCRQLLQQYYAFFHLKDSLVECTSQLFYNGNDQLC